MIIALCGFMGSGKDTVADILIQEYLFVKESFANSLKNVLSNVFLWDRNLLEGDTIESRKWRDTIDEWWSYKLGIPDLTPRKMLQFWGTDLIRKQFHNDIWVYSLEKKLYLSEERCLLAKEQSKNIVITDCRFHSEYESLKQKKAIFIRVWRYDPEWLQLAINANNGCSISKEELTKKGIHESEYISLSFKTDYIILNTGSITKTRSSIINVMNLIFCEQNRLQV